MNFQVRTLTLVCLFFLVLPIAAFCSWGEPMETLFSDEPLQVSGYVGPEAQFTSMKGNFGFLLGGRGGAIFNDRFVVGGAAYGLVQPTLNLPLDGDTKRMGVGYGGLLLEYYFSPRSLINYSVGALVGSGGVAEIGDRAGRRTAFFVLQPEVNVFVNVTRFFRVGTGVAYRYSNGLNLNGFTDDDFRGFSGSLIFAFGGF